MRRSMALVIPHLVLGVEITVLSFGSEFKVINRASSRVWTRRTSSAVLAACFSATGKLFATCNSDKQLQVFDTRADWSSINRSVPKRVTAIRFSLDEKHVYISDKAGDVYKYVVDGSEDGELLLGHVSMLLDMVLSPDDRFIVTADRDEKIRVSCLPNAYNIACYCLGHRDFVSQVKIHPKVHHLLLSGSGDGYIGLWNYDTGSCLELLPLPRGKDEAPVFATCISCCSVTGLIAVVGVVSDLLWFFKLAEDESHLEFITMTHLQVPPLHLAFNADGMLLILVRSNVSPLLLINASGVLERKEVQFTSSQSYFGDTDLSLQDWNFSEGLDLSIDYSTLKKSAYDNTVDYRERKRRRLEGKDKEEHQISSEIDERPDRENTV